ncbi:MAG: metallophosphatase family protein [Bacilli bacterium]|nr:metallophosphatase family protein [Bacilli bacterium]
MKICLVSDSHGLTEEIAKIYKKHPDCDLYLHAGDSEDFESSLCPFETVRGNCDHYDIEFNKRMISTPYGNLLMTHYPNTTYADGIKIFVHGHTHKIEAICNNGVITICPGSVAFSRDATGESYAILNICPSNVKIDFYSVENKKVFLKKKII